MSWSDLVNNYGLDVETDYDPGTVYTTTTSPYYVFTMNNLSGVLKIPPTITKLGAYAFAGCDSLITIK